MGEHAQGQPGADRAVGRPGPAAKMNTPEGVRPRPRPSVLIPPVSPHPEPSGAASSAPVGYQSTPTRAPAPTEAPPPVPSAPTPAAGPVPAPASPAQAPVQPAPNPRPAQPPAARARPTSGAPAQAPTQAGRVARAAVQPSLGPRSARLFVTHVDPWSVMKQAFLLSLAMAAVILVAFATLWFALESAGVIDAITRTATDVGGESGANVTSFLDFSKVMGLALVLAGIETVLLTAMATLFAFLYNLAVGIGGGLEITLSEED